MAKKTPKAKVAKAPEPKKNPILYLIYNLKMDEYLSCLFNDLKIARKALRFMKAYYSGTLPENSPFPLASKEYSTWATYMYNYNGDKLYEFITGARVVPAEVLLKVAK